MSKSVDKIQHIRQIQIKATRNVNDLFAGLYRSTFKGRGLEFEDVREYEIGDDIRTIDWNVTARHQKPYVKNFREERELTIILMMDISKSTHFTHQRKLKSEVIAEIAAVLAFSAIKNQDKVGLVLFTEDVELYLPPRKGLRHVLRVIRELLFFSPNHRGTDINKVLSFVNKVQKKTAICFLISDFLAEDFSHAGTITNKHHDLIAIHASDEYEKSIPNLGLVTFKDLETEKTTIVDTSSSYIRENYERDNQIREKEIKNLMGRLGVDLISVGTDEGYVEALKLFFKREGDRDIELLLLILFYLLVL